jgi:hypothetical protein
MPQAVQGLDSSAVERHCAHLMTKLIRPEARAWMSRWSEPAIALAVALLGLWLALRWFGVMVWLGWALAALGLGWLWGAVQRARFAAGGAGAGMVQVIEGEIRFFGPLGGGFAPLDGIRAVSLSADRAHWLIETSDGTGLVIPRAAHGAEALFDAFATLPGFEMEKCLRMAAQSPSDRAQPIWHRPLGGRISAS